LALEPEKVAVAWPSDERNTWLAVLEPACVPAGVRVVRARDADLELKVTESSAGRNLDGWGVDTDRFGWRVGETLQKTGKLSPPDNRAWSAYNKGAPEGDPHF
jgi:hypothetical protein